MDAATSQGLDLGVPPIVLLVDDDRDTLDMYSTFLESSGMWVATATSPTQALEAVGEVKPDIIVTDLRFGGRQSGAAFVHTLREQAATHDTPLIVLSGQATEQLPAQMRSEADLLLVKPVLPDTLLEDVRMLLERSRELRQRSQQAQRRVAQLRDKTSELMDRSRSLRQQQHQQQQEQEQLEARLRRCPQCQSQLDWIERGTIGGAEYDYYRWCLRGCGLYCYDRNTRKWIKLA